MTTVNVHEAKTHLSRLLEAVAAGEEIIIARAGKPIAKLVPIAKPKREPGRLLLIEQARLEGFTVVTSDLSTLSRTCAVVAARSKLGGLASLVARMERSGIREQR